MTNPTSAVTITAVQDIPHCPPWCVADHSVERLDARTRTHHGNAGALQVGPGQQLIVHLYWPQRLTRSHASDQSPYLVVYFPDSETAVLQVELEQAAALAELLDGLGADQAADLIRAAAATLESEIR